MRHFAYRGIALAAVISFSASGQQAISQPASVIAQRPVVSVDLPIEPAHEPVTPTLAEAAALNDFPQFDQLYRSAADRGEASAYAELHRFWTWSLNDSTGAFYGRSTYERLAAVYPGYAAYIADFTLVDAHGQAFYPSSETRRFLLTQALSGSAPHTSTMRVAAATTRATVRRSTPVVPVVTARHAVAPPALVTVTIASPAAAQAPDAQPLPVARVIPMPARAPQEESQPQDHRLGEALLLTILGLLGVGIVSLMLHTPPEEHRASRRSEA